MSAETREYIFSVDELQKKLKIVGIIDSIMVQQTKPDDNKPTGIKVKSIVQVE